ncbi:uncharacterized protein EI97DRAFT_8288 [Westerdykella ornata]|uniref:Uncharacterized protein n=1 Tax=Westerdykella ornata TaxID=318751 RepID=A0A6A6JW06_WESOR|nr:uncharacterized protein EI97DRAFT_8288 [Westerdykella ornata]KAF2280782.1 hypothetical protein EI97DRAFT_8288 [Westerdykella ornata]
MPSFPMSSTIPRFRLSVTHVFSSCSFNAPGPMVRHIYCFPVYVHLRLCFSPCLLVFMALDPWFGTFPALLFVVFFVVGQLKSHMVFPFIYSFGSLSGTRPSVSNCP